MTNPENTADLDRRAAQAAQDAEDDAAMQWALENEAAK